MKITKKQLKKIIQEARMMHPTPSPMMSRADPAIKAAVESQRLVEYEQYVDEDGNVWDDEGNVSRRGRGFGRQYGGETYTGTRTPWSGRSSRRKTSHLPSRHNKTKIEALEAILELEDNKFLKSILSQMKADRGLSAKQISVAQKIIKKIVKNSGMVGGEELAKLFGEGNTIKIKKTQLRKVIQETLKLTLVG